MTTQPFMSPTPGPRSQSPSRVTGQPSAHTVSAWPSRSSVGPAPSSRRAVSSWPVRVTSNPRAANSSPNPSATASTPATS